jgi:hypothetical protein
MKHSLQAEADQRCSNSYLHSRYLYLVCGFFDISCSHSENAAPFEMIRRVLSWQGGNEEGDCGNQHRFIPLQNTH